MIDLFVHPDTKVSEAAEGAVLGLTHSLQVLETIGPSIHTDLQPQVRQSFVLYRPAGKKFVFF